MHQTSSMSGLSPAHLNVVNAVTLRRWQDQKFSSEFAADPAKAISSVAREMKVTGLDIQAVRGRIEDSPIGDAPMPQVIEKKAWTPFGYWTDDCGRYWTATVECLCGPSETGSCECQW